MKVRDNGVSKVNIRRAIILIVILTSLVYVNSLKNSFVWDDCIVIVNNDFVKSWKNFPAIFTKAYLTPLSEIRHFGIHNLGSGETSYRPVVTTSYFIDYSLWKLNPFGYHLTNLLLHIFNAILLYFLVDLIARNKKVALLASLLFALHPVNTEVVNVISFREDLLAFLFFIFSFILFIKLDDYGGRKRIYCYIASIVSFLLALFSKEISITLPIVLILYSYFFASGEKAKKLSALFKFRYVGYIAAALFYLLIWRFYKSNISEFFIEYPYPGGNFYTNLLTMSRVIAKYIGWLFLPIDIQATLSETNSIFTSYSLLDLRVLFSIALIIISFVIAIKIRKTSKEISFAIFWFFITLLPVSNMFLISIIIASRYLYIPSIGFCFFVAVLLFKLPKSKVSFISPNILQRVARDIVVVLLIFYSMFTVTRNLTWRNDTVFWLENVENYPDSALAHSNLGNCFRKRGFLDKAISEFKIAINLEPNYAKYYSGLGVCYYEKGMLDEAIREFEKAQELGPNLLEVYTNLGYVFEAKGLYKEAIDCYKRAIEIYPMYIKAYNNLGLTYAKMENWDEAKKVWEKALEIEPYCREVQYNLKKLRQSGQLNY